MENFQFNPNKPPIYNKDGGVIDPEVAREGALAERPYHKKALGIFKVTKDKVMRGDIASELAMEKGIKIKKKDLPPIIQEKVKEQLKIINDQHEDCDFAIERIIQSDIGGGIIRFHIFAEDDEVVMPQIGLLPDDGEYCLVYDIKDGKIINSSVRGYDNPFFVIK